MNTKLEVHSLPLRRATSLFWNQRKLLASPLPEPTRSNISKTTILPLILYKCETWSVTLRDKFWSGHCENSRSQRPCVLRHEPISLARKLESWVRIPLNTWMSLCVYSVFVLLCVDNGIVSGWSPIQGVLSTFSD
jgi:hypothetical protein